MNALKDLDVVVFYRSTESQRKIGKPITLSPENSLIINKIKMRHENINEHFF